MAKVLVVGGAGYVGSAACAWLIDQGHDIWVLDDLSTGHRDLVLSGGFTLGRAGGPEAAELLLRERFDCVMHFAASAQVAESVTNPGKYAENNVDQTRHLIDAMLKAGTRNLIFSSTAAVFGNPGDRPITEAFPRNPVNPYGQSKKDAELLLEESAVRGNLRSVALRYFNAAGADEKCRVGERHSPETHLIPNILRSALRAEPLRIFGDDYPTPDGTCIRDYVHVTDLAKAHEKAMEHLLSASSGPGRFEAFNLGTEKGYSVREVIKAAESVSGHRIETVLEGRRPGDPPRLIADSKNAQRELGFSVDSGTALVRVLRSAWEWEKKDSKPRRAVFLDRDGTLNVDPGYLKDPSSLRMIPGVGEALDRLSASGYLLIVVTNQSGVGRGIIPPEALDQVHARINDLIRVSGAKIIDFRSCIHAPDEKCGCRKPSPKLILDAAVQHGIDLAASVMVGDKSLDLAAGRSAGCGKVALVRTGAGAQTEAGLKTGETDFIGDDLRAVADWILSAQGPRRS